MLSRLRNDTDQKLPDVPKQLQEQRGSAVVGTHVCAQQSVSNF